MMQNQNNNHHEDLHPTSPLIINSMSKITGDLVLSSDVRIDGSVEGNITTTRSVIIGENGHLKGNIKSNSLSIYGRMEGISEVAESTHLHGTAVYVGRLNTGLISISKGCAINAFINMEIPAVEFISPSATKKEETEIQTPKTAEPVPTVVPTPSVVSVPVVNDEPKIIVKTTSEPTVTNNSNLTGPNNAPKKIKIQLNPDNAAASKVQAQQAAPAPASVGTTASVGSSFLLSKLKDNS